MQKKDIMVISIPKSGTHYLNQILRGIPPYKRFKGLWLLPNQNYMEKIKNRKKPNVILSHLYYDLTIKEYLDKEKIPRIFIYRDPRDIVVSWMFYVKKKGKDHFQYDYLFNQLENDHDRIMAVIEGFETNNGEQLGIKTLFSHYMKWQEDRNTLTVNYEDLVLPSKKSATISKIVDYLWEDIKHQNLSRKKCINLMLNNTNPANSPTFRKGIIGDWRNYFTEQHKNVFKDLTGDLLIQLGYENDLDW